MRKPKQDTVSVNLRLPKGLHAAIKQKAEAQNRSLNGQILRALAVFMLGDQSATAHPSKLPGSDPKHVCNLYCDGQDGDSSKCAQERRTAKRKKSK